MKTILGLFYLAVIVICITTYKLDKQKQYITELEHTITEQRELIVECLAGLSEGAAIVTHNTQSRDPLESPKSQNRTNRSK